MSDSKKQTDFLESQKATRRWKRRHCEEHGYKMTLYCNECLKPLCTECSVAHKTSAIILIKPHLYEVKAKVQLRYENIQPKIDLTKAEIQDNDVQLEKLMSERATVESEIRATVRNAVKLLEKKEEELIKRVNELTEQDLEELRLMLTRDLKIHHQAHGLELKNEAQLSEMDLSPYSRAGTDTREARMDLKTDPQIIDQCQSIQQTLDEKQLTEMNLSSGSRVGIDTRDSHKDLKTDPQIQGQSQFVQLNLEFDDKAKLSELGLSSCLGAGTDVTNSQKELHKQTVQKDLPTNDKSQTIQHEVDLKDEMQMSEVELSSGLGAGTDAKESPREIIDQSQCIKQDPELENELLISEMTLSSGPGAKTDVSHTQREVETEEDYISFFHDLPQLKERIGLMDVKINNVNVETDNIDLTASPVQVEVIDYDNGGRVIDGVDGMSIMNVAGTKVVVAVDKHNERLKAYFKRRGQNCSSVLRVPYHPNSITVISEGKIAVSFPWYHWIKIVLVTPDLELLSTILTRRQYWGLSTLDQSTLVAGSFSTALNGAPLTVDLIDLKGAVLKTLITLPEKDYCGPLTVHATRKNTIVVSNEKTFICLTRSGEIVFEHKPNGKGQDFTSIGGITSTITGDVIVSKSYRVLQLSQTGEIIRVLPIPYLEHLVDLCVDEDKLYVATRYQGLHVFKFG